MMLYVACACLLGCATGRRALKSGNYEKATHLSANHLSNFKNSENAQDVLLAAYPQARALLLAKASAAEGASYQFHWEDAVDAYDKLEELADSIEMSEGANYLNLDVFRSSEKLEASRLRAAIDRELAGDKSMTLEGRYNARKAYEHYEKALSFNPNSPVSLSMKLEQALDAATIRLAIDLNIEGSTLMYSPALLEEIEWEIKGRQLGPFVKWVQYESDYDDGDLQKPNHVLSLSIGEWDIGRERSRTSVKTLRRTIEVDGESGDEEEAKKRVDVSAKVKTVRLEKESVGSLFLTVYDLDLRMVVMSSPVVERIHWSDEFHQVTGDERALSNPSHYRMRRRPNAPSDHWQEKELIDSLSQKTKRSLRVFYDSFY